MTNDATAFPDPQQTFTEQNTTSPETLILSLEGFEGPLDLLLSLARDQKVDLGTISILAIAEQYLAIITAAQQIQLDLAGEWLVMAAWLAWLKSRWLLPDPPPPDAPDRATLARDLTFQLQRLDAMRQASARLFDQPYLGQDVFVCGHTMDVPVDVKPIWHLPLADLLRALGATLRRREPDQWMIAASALCPLEESVRHLRAFLGERHDWVRLDNFWSHYHALRNSNEPPSESLILSTTIAADEATLQARSVAASSFLAALELAKEGIVDVRQDAPFATVWILGK